MADIEQDSLAIFRQNPTLEVYNPEVSYTVNTHILDSNGAIYVVIKPTVGTAVEADQIEITNTDYFLLSVPHLSEGTNIDAILGADTTPDNSIVIWNATGGTDGTGAYEVVTFTEGQNYTITTAGEALPERVGAGVVVSMFGFGSFPVKSMANKSSYKTRVDLTPRVDPFPDIGNPPLDLVTDRCGHLVISIANNSSTLNVAELPNYSRINFANNFAEARTNRESIPTRYTSFAGNYVVLMDNGNVYTRNANSEFVQNIYGAFWTGRQDMDIPSQLGFTQTTILDFEQAGNFYLFLITDDSDGTHYLRSVRFNSDGTFSTIRRLTVGADAPSTIGFLSYPNTTADDLEVQICYTLNGTAHYTNEFSTSIRTVANTSRIFSHRSTSFYVDDGNDNLLNVSISMIGSSATRTTIPVPIKSTSIENGTEHGLILIYEDHIMVIGTNMDSELGTGDDTEVTTATRVNIPVSSPLKDGMYCDLGSTRCVVLWSDSEVWMCGLGRGTREELGRFMNFEFDNIVGSNDYLFNNSTFVRVFNTNAIIQDVCVTNGSNNSICNPAIYVLLNDGLVYAKGHNLTDIHGRVGDQRLETRISDSIFGATERGHANRILDGYNNMWRLLGI